jgi:hypothetical protein
MSAAADFHKTLAEFIGETVTIYTTSGGQSGRGFTGVLISVFDHFVRLVSHIGASPACALGSSCCFPRGSCRSRVFSVGSVTDIPIHTIAAFVHNAV